jgi:hypothetical protein
MRYVFKAIPEPDDNPHEDFTLTMETDAVVLPELIQVFEQFLRGVGFWFKGNLEVVEEEEQDENE